MADFNPGDRVRVVERETTAADGKSGLYYDYFRNLEGKVDRVYSDGSAAIDVDLDSLPEGVCARHLEIQEAVQNRWIASLSQEQRGRLTEAQKKMTLSYKILVKISDLLPGGKHKPKSAAASAKTGKPTKETETPVEHRKSENELTKAEEEHLKSIAQQQTK